MNNHQVNQSGTCVIEGCPCRGWSAQEGVRAAKEESMNTNDTVSALKEFGEAVEQIPSDVKDEIIRQDERERLQEIRAASHQPAARGGGDEWSVEGGSLVGRRRIRDEARYWVADTVADHVADQIVREHNQHQSLVAERERLRKLLKAAVNAMRSYQYGNSSPDLADEIQQAVNAALSDQKG